MKVLLLGFVRIAHMPYMYDYVRLLGSSNELHLISWNRNGRPDAPVPEGIAKSFVFGDHVEDAAAFCALPTVRPRRYRRRGLRQGGGAALDAWYHDSRPPEERLPWALYS